MIQLKLILGTVTPYYPAVNKILLSISMFLLDDLDRRGVFRQASG